MQMWEICRANPSLKVALPLRNTFGPTVTNTQNLLSKSTIIHYVLIKGSTFQIMVSQMIFSFSLDKYFYWIGIIFY